MGAHPAAGGMAALYVVGLSVAPILFGFGFIDIGYNPRVTGVGEHKIVNAKDWADKAQALASYVSVTRTLTLGNGETTST